VYLVGRFYPVFTPEVLLVVATIGVVTLFMAATIAITATDIKRVLAYSTVSQLGYMMVALGVGGWLAGMMHLVTHAFFKSLLFLCSGSVIHAVHTNEMTEMGGLRKKMPVTAYTMLIGCLAIAGVSIPFVIGFSGYYSKDMILEQAFSFLGTNRSFVGVLFFGAATGGAAMTAFYMFRLWFMTFAGEPRNRERYDHAHESPRVMYIPLIVLAVFATAVAWKLPFSNLSLENLLEQARPLGTAATVESAMTGLTWPDEHFAHQPAQFWTIVFPVTLLATLTALGGIGVAIAMYGVGFLKPEEVRRQFPRIYSFLKNKWWFDELYQWLFVRPTHFIAGLVSRIDLRWIDGLIHAIATATRWFAQAWDRIADQGIVDGLVNMVGRGTYRIGISLKGLQTGSLRQYVMFIVVGVIAIFLLISIFWSPTLAQ
jgi:NADH-quinone oxidoreductase subunit L